MVEEVLQEINKLKTGRISISVPLDEKGSYDRECPNDECWPAL